MFELVKKLTQTFGVSGNEESIRELIASEIKSYVDEIKVDTLGNLIAIKKGSGKKIMVASHMDEIGVIVIHIDKNGFLRFSTIGGVYTFHSICQRVRFKNGVTGIIFYEEKISDIKNLKLENLYIDIGAKNKEEAEKKIQIGDVACFVGETIQEGDMIISKALDDRSGCAVAIKALQQMCQTKNELYFVFTVQEELGLRGAKTAAFQIEADMAIAIDVTKTGDTPESKVMEVRCGHGPAIKLKDRSIICHKDVIGLLENSAKRLQLPYQFEILETGGSDVGAIHLSVGGVASGAISIPCRNVHSTIEMVNINDLNNAIKLLIESVI